MSFSDLAYPFDVLTAGEGGLSVFSGTHGWACDTVIEYEVNSLTDELPRFLITDNYPRLYWRISRL